MLHIQNLLQKCRYNISETVLSLQVFNVSKVTSHSRFASNLTNLFEGDIAILKLDRSVVASRYVSASENFWYHSLSAALCAIFELCRHIM